MLPAIGSLGVLNSSGRLGVVVDARPLAAPQDGRQPPALQLHTVDQRDAQGQAAARISGLALLPAEAGERPGAGRRTLATREDRGAALARLPDRQASEQAAVERLRRRDPPPRREETAPSAGADDPAGPVEELHQRGSDRRPDATGDAVGGQAAASRGDPAALSRRDAWLAAAAAASPAARHDAGARGLRRYAEAGEPPPQAPRVDLTS